MNKIIFDINGKEVGTIELNDTVFGKDIQTDKDKAMAVVHQVVVAQMANKRQGTKSALTRTEVRGGGKKPWRQKGTGRARQGSIRAPQWIKGGVVFAPKPRDFSQKLNKKMKDAAIKTVLSAKAQQENGFVVLNDLNVPAKTKSVATMLDNLSLSGRTLIVYAGKNDNAVLAARNIPTVEIACVDLLNVYDVVANANLVITVQAVQKLEEEYKQ
jgi:large subunit ribosomal protein L4